MKEILGDNYKMNIMQNTNTLCSIDEVTSLRL